MHHLESAVQMK